LKTAVAPGGKPLTENVIGLPNCPCGAIVNTNVALWPGRMVRDEIVVGVKLKSRTDCTSEAEVLPSKLLLPL